MNCVQIVGRLTRDPEIRYTDAGMSIGRFTVAVNRRGKQDEADFISCVAFGKSAEFLEKYFRKGQRIGLIGRIQTGSYQNQEGNTVYTTDVIADNLEFVENKQDSGAKTQNYQPQSRPAPSSALPDGFMNIPDGVDDEGLPFN